MRLCIPTLVWCVCKLVSEMHTHVVCECAAHRKSRVCAHLHAAHAMRVCARVNLRVPAHVWMQVLVCAHPLVHTHTCT